MIDVILMIVIILEAAVRVDQSDVIERLVDIGEEFECRWAVHGRHLFGQGFYNAGCINSGTVQFCWPYVIWPHASQYKGARYGS
ncbi:hypothetical protein VTN02DRAFT_5828 [Thermoascus thermophilus]